MHGAVTFQMLHLTNLGFQNWMVPWELPADITLGPIIFNSELYKDSWDVSSKTKRLARQKCQIQELDFQDRSAPLLL